MDIKADLNINNNSILYIGNVYSKSYIDYKLNSIESKLNTSVKKFKLTSTVTGEDITQSSGNKSIDVNHKLATKNIVVSVMKDDVMISCDSSSTGYKVEYPNENLILITVHQPGTYYITVIG